MSLRIGLEGGLTAESYVVVMLGWLDGLYVSTDVELLNRVLEVGYRRVSVIVVTKDLDGLLDLVRSIDG